MKVSKMLLIALFLSAVVSGCGDNAHPPQAKAKTTEEVVPG